MKRAGKRMASEDKAAIDAMGYEEMLRMVRYVQPGHRYFILGDEVTDYFENRMADLKKTADHVAASKRIGWGT